MKRGIIVGFSLLGLAGLILLWVNLGKKEAPNVLLIILDAARADHFSCYGYDKPTTPHIDRLAQDGVVFLNHHSNATYTHASLPKMLTSRFYSCNIYSNTLWRWKIKRETSGSLFFRFDDEQISLPEVMSLNGYRTGIFHNHILLRKRTRAVLGFEESAYVIPHLKKYPGDRGIMTEMIDWIERVQDDKFFAYCHIMSPHSPYPAKREDREFLGNFPDRRVEAVRQRIFNVVDNNTEGWPDLDIQILNGLYDSNLKHSDWWIGYLIERLEYLGLLEKTTIIISSDHGENLGAHHHLGHGGLPWETVTHVPMILYNPGRIPKGVKVSGLSESVDLMPTILDLCGLALPAGKSADGISLKKFFNRPHQGKAVIFTGDSIRTRAYKLILSRNMLFKLPGDVGEIKNIVQREPKVKLILTNYHNKRLGPLRDRYLNAKLDHPPDYPFYVALQDMQISPPEKIVRHQVKDWDFDRFHEILPKSNKPWIVAAGRMSYGLVRRPGIPGANRVHLETKLPNGEYSCDLLFGILGDVSVDEISRWCRYRWRSTDPFVSSPNIQDLKKRFAAFRCFYIHLGKKEIQDNRLIVDLELSPDINLTYLISHIKFTPLGVTQVNRLPTESDQKTREAIEKLKTLGYL